MAASPQVEIVAYSEPWLGELVPMWRSSFETALGITDPHPLQEQMEYVLRSVLPQNKVQLALSGQQLLGFIAASSESVSQLYVRPGCQRRGVGSRLLQWAKQNSSGSLWLYTFKKNLAAQAFYESHGFAAVQHGFEPTWQLEDIKYFWSAGAKSAP